MSDCCPLHPHMVYSYETNRPLCLGLILHAISYIAMATDSSGNGHQWVAQMVLQMK